ncbi:MAG: GntR family transcriptional regulator [Chloroflexi bacterium]|jgi:GntR family transcriptional regulator|nr:GntR family transcriptional regulator [Chloroflexota bacterium]
MGLWIQISAGSSEPIYVQVVEQIGEAIARGELSSGDKLPAVRKLAGELVINPNTVARAYSFLEQAGLVTTKTGSGTFVSDPKLRKGDAADVNILTERMDTLIARGLNLGMGAGDLAGLFEGRLAKFVKKSEEHRDKKDE